MESGQPNLYVVAGPNGAGKSTFARLFLPEYADCREFVNADLIAAGLSPFNPESLALQAGKLMLERIESLAEARADFGFETTLAGKSWVPVLQRLRERGYRLHIFFLWIPGPDLALKRIEERVLAGGHSVPEEVVRRRFRRGLRNFSQIYGPLVDVSLTLDNSSTPSKPASNADIPEICVKAMRALREAAEAGIAEHWRNGRPVYVWRDEQVMALHPDGTAVPLKREEQGTVDEWLGSLSRLTPVSLPVPTVEAVREAREAEDAAIVAPLQIEIRGSRNSPS